MLQIERESLSRAGSDATPLTSVWRPLSDFGEAAPACSDAANASRVVLTTSNICCYSLSPTMSALRLLSHASRRATATPATRALGRRGYAEVADKIKLSLVLPHQVRPALFLAVVFSN